jgi:hypothetical protein
MKNRPLLIIAFAGAIILWAAYHTLGGIEGIRADPYMSLAVFAITLLICFPVFWFRYRRMQHEPIYEACLNLCSMRRLMFCYNTPIVIVCLAENAGAACGLGAGDCRLPQCGRSRAFAVWAAWW